MSSDPTVSSGDSIEVAVLEAFTAYEKALTDNDVATMNEFFSSTADVVRFGIADEQWGLTQLREWRRSATPVDPGRTLYRTSVDLVAPGVAVVTTLFRYPERAVLGRQTQIWVSHGPSERMENWLIVGAHVSERPENVDASGAVEPAQDAV